jgi:hypothetical protein
MIHYIDVRTSTALRVICRMISLMNMEMDVSLGETICNKVLLLVPTSACIKNPLLQRYQHSMAILK